MRIRDPEASLRGEIDWVVILHLAVWGAAGLWVLWHFVQRFQARHLLLRLRLPHILGLAMILVLAASSWVSDAPALTAFKVYQMLVSLLFAQTFVERFGAWTSLKAMLWGNALLCAAIAFCAFFIPDEVWTFSEFNPDPSRLFGGRIATTGVVAMLAVMLLLTCVRRIWRTLPLVLLAGLVAMLLVSLMRTAYLAAFVFFALVLLKRPDIKPLRQTAYILSMVLVMLYVCDRLPSLSHYRNPETVSTLGDRVGLWRHLTAVTLSRSPWLGLGYYSASRVHGPEYNEGLGTAHSTFFEVLAGGGVVSFALLVGLCVTLSVYAASLLYARRDRLSFATSVLFIVCLLFASTWEEIDSGPVATGFWYCVAVLPLLHEQRRVLSSGVHKRLPVGLGAVPDPELS